MKPTAALFAVAALGIFSLSFLFTKKPEAQTIGIPICRGDRYSIDFQRAENFEHWKYRLAGGPVLRRNAVKLTERDSAIVAYKKAIEAMRKRKPTDPTSWQFQADIHGNRLKASKNEWDQCQHGNDFFLSWHRMYLYFFERIVRKASGDPRFALPFWDYSTREGRAIPAVFRKPATDLNALWTKSREPKMNSGGYLTDAEADTRQAFASKNLLGYFNFQDNLENGPHNAIHMACAGSPSRLMGDVATAGRDPLFWIHHCNIDRLWEKFMRESGLPYPTTNDKWANKEFLFYDEDGRPVRMTGKQVVDIAAQLDYDYEGLSPVKAPAVPSKTSTATADSLSKTVVFTAENQSASEKPKKVKLNKTKNKPPKGKRAPGAPPKDYMLVLRDVSIEKVAASGSYEVYLNLPKGAVPDPSGGHFCGLVNLFSLETNREQRLLVTDVVKKLMAAAQGMGEVSVDIVHRERDGEPGSKGEKSWKKSKIEIGQVELVELD